MIGASVGGGESAFRNDDASGKRANKAWLPALALLAVTSAALAETVTLLDSLYRRVQAEVRFLD